jgi:hypothetical protein
VMAVRVVFWFGVVVSGLLRVKRGEAGPSLCAG